MCGNVVSTPGRRGLAKPLRTQTLSACTGFPTSGYLRWPEMTCPHPRQCSDHRSLPEFGDRFAGHFVTIWGDRKTTERCFGSFLFVMSERAYRSHGVFPPYVRTILFLTKLRAMISRKDSAHSPRPRSDTILPRILFGGNSGCPFPVRRRLEHQEKSDHDEYNDRAHAQAVASGPVYRHTDDERPEKSRDLTG